MMAAPRSGIALIGMPGAGKSTIGVLLSKRLALDFLDTDLLIQLHEQRTLQQILDSEGYLRLRAIEEEVLLGVDAHGCVVATGGSAVYSEPAMRHLAEHARIIWLDVPIDELRRRIHDYDSRGIACRPGQDFASLYAERCALYRRHAATRIDCAGLGVEEVVLRIVERLR